MQTTPSGSLSSKLGFLRGYREFQTDRTQNDVPEPFALGFRSHSSVAIGMAATDSNAVPGPETIGRGTHVGRHVPGRNVAGAPRASRSVIPELSRRAGRY